VFLSHSSLPCDKKAKKAKKDNTDRNDKKDRKEEKDREPIRDGVVREGVCAAMEVYAVRYANVIGAQDRPVDIFGHIGAETARLLQRTRSRNIRGVG
jgi:hypothetical protein